MARLTSYPSLRDLLTTIALVGLLTLPAAAAGSAQELKGREWLTHFDAAMAEASKGDRLILIDMWADWCGWCRALDEQVLSTPEFLEFARDFVFLRVDTMDDDEGSYLQKTYGVERLPTTVLVTAEGARVGSLTGMFETADYIEKLRGEIAEYERIVTFYEKIRDSDKVELKRQLAKELHERLDGRRAAGLYEKLGEEAAKGSAKDSEDAAWLAYYTADAYRLGRDFDQARVFAGRAQELASRLDLAELSEKSDLLTYFIAKNDGDCAGAEVSLEGFLERHPESEMRFEIRRFLRQLRRGDVTDCRS